MSSDDVPLEFLCPIGQSIMEDPVLLSDGYTYERAYIEIHIRLHRNSPMTRQTAHLHDLVPNVALREAIEQFLASQSASRPTVASFQPLNAGVSNLSLSVAAAVDVDGSIVLGTSLTPLPSLPHCSAIDLVCVIDASNSMNLLWPPKEAGAQHTATAGGVPIDPSLIHTPWSLVLHAVRCLVAMLGDNDRLGVVLFNDHAQVHVPLTPCTLAGRAEIESRVRPETMRAEGRTNLYAGLVEGLKMMVGDVGSTTQPGGSGASAGGGGGRGAGAGAGGAAGGGSGAGDRGGTTRSTSSTPRLQHMIVLTDGAPTDRPARSEAALFGEMLQTVSTSGRRPPTVHFASFGQGDVDVTLLRALARAGCGEYIFINDVSMLATSIVNWAAGVVTTCAVGLDVAVEEVEVVGDTTTPSGGGVGGGGVGGGGGGGGGGGAGGTTTGGEGILNPPPSGPLVTVVRHDGVDGDDDDAYERMYTSWGGIAGLGAVHVGQARCAVWTLRLPPAVAISAAMGAGSAATGNAVAGGHCGANAAAVVLRVHATYTNSSGVCNDTVEITWGDVVRAMQSPVTGTGVAVGRGAGEAAMGDGTAGGTSGSGAAGAGGGSGDAAPTPACHPGHLLFEIAKDRFLKSVRMANIIASANARVSGSGAPPTNASSPNANTRTGTTAPAASTNGTADAVLTSTAGMLSDIEARLRRAPGQVGIVSIPPHRDAPAAAAAAGVVVDVSTGDARWGRGTRSLPSRAGGGPTGGPGGARPTASSSSSAPAAMALGASSQEESVINMQHLSPPLKLALFRHELLSELAAAVVPAAYSKWGKFYLPCIAKAHARGVCMNFKDISLQIYTSKAFIRVRSYLAALMVSLPVHGPLVALDAKGKPYRLMAPSGTASPGGNHSATASSPPGGVSCTPSNQPASPQSGGGGAGGAGVGGGAAIGRVGVGDAASPGHNAQTRVSAAPPATASRSMLPRTYYDRSGGCVHPHTLVSLWGGGRIHAAQIRKGMRVVAMESANASANATSTSSRAPRLREAIVDLAVHITRCASARPLVHVSNHSGNGQGTSSARVSAWHPVMLMDAVEQASLPTYTSPSTSPSHVAMAPASAWRFASELSRSCGDSFVDDVHDVHDPNDAGADGSLSPPFVVALALRWANNDQDAVGVAPNRPVAFISGSIAIAALGHGVVDDVTLRHEFFGSEASVAAFAQYVCADGVARIPSGVFERATDGEVKAAVKVPFVTSSSAPTVGSGCATGAGAACEGGDACDACASGPCAPGRVVGIRARYLEMRTVWMYNQHVASRLPHVRV